MAKQLRGKDYLTIPEAADRLNLPRMTVYRWASRGETANGEKLDVLKDALTRHYYIAETSIDELVERYSEENRYQPV